MEKTNDWNKKFPIEKNENWIKIWVKVPPALQSVESLGWMTQNGVTSNWMMEPNWREKIKSVPSFLSFDRNPYLRVWLLWNFRKISFRFLNLTFSPRNYLNYHQFDVKNCVKKWMDIFYYTRSDFYYTISNLTELDLK